MDFALLKKTWSKKWETKYPLIILWMTEYFLLTLFRPPVSFSLLTFTNVTISPWTFLTFSFNLFHTLVYNFKAMPCFSLKLLNLKQENPSKKKVKLYKIELMKTSLHRSTRVTKLWSQDQIYNIIWVTWWYFPDNVMDWNCDVITVFSK